MKYYVIINGESSLDIQGLVISKLPDISKPLMRNEKIEIDGRDGDIITKLGYSAYDKTIEIGLWGTYDIDTIIEYFNQDGVITFSNEIDKYYNFSILNREDFINKLEKFKTASITLHCQPFKYEVNEETKEIENEYVEQTGTSISVENTLSAPMEIDLKGNTQQEQLSGKNLMNIPNGTGTRENNTFTALNQEITINSNTSGTESAFYLNDVSQVSRYANSYPNARDYNMTSTGGTYTLTTYFSYRPVNTLQIYLFTNKRVMMKSSRDNWQDGKLIHNITLDSDEYIKSVQCYVAASNVFNNFKITAQLEQGSTSTSYEQYCGGIPSPNPDYPQDVNVVSGNNDIVVCGKNLFDNTTYSLKSDTLTWTPTTTGGILTNTGTWGNGLRWRFVLDTNKQYTFRLNNSNASVFTYIRSYTDNTYSTQKTRILQDGNGDITKVFTPDSTYIEIFFLNSASVSNVEISNMQLEVGNQATTYEPYNGTTYNIDLPVENLFDKNGNFNYGNSKYATSLNTNGQIVSTSNFSIQRSAGLLVSNLEPNAQYTLSGTLVSANGTDTNNNANIQIMTTTPSVLTTCHFDKSLIKPYDFTFTFNTGNNTSLWFSFNGKNNGIEGTTETIFDNIQLEQGSKANTYTPYGTTPIELCKIGTYQDYFYKDSGKWYLHKETGKVVLSDLTTWSQTGYGFKTASSEKLDAIYLANNNTIPQLYCSCFVPITPNNAYGTVGDKTSGISYFYNEPYLLARQTNISTLQDFLTKINNQALYYILASATNTEITDTTLIEQLEAIANATSYEGETNINQVNNDLPFIITASIFTGTDTITIENKGNTTAKPTMTIYGKGTIGVYLNGNQVFTINLGDEEYITIDTQNMEASKDTILKNRLVVGDYNSFVLQTGNNTLKFTGLVDKVEINNYSRWV